MARNYTQVYACGWHLHFHDDGPPPVDFDTENWFLGQNQDQANGLATVYVANSIAADPDHVTGYTFAVPKRYILISPIGFVTSWVVQFATPDAVHSGSEAYSIIDSIGQQLGIDLSISPKHQGVYPWDPKGK